VKKSSKRSTGSYTVQYGKERIAFTIECADRKRLSISVHPDLSVSVVAPKEKGTDEIIARVKRRAPWIIRQKRHFEKYHPIPPERRFVSGETHLYLGRQYRLKVREDSRNDIKLRGRFFVASVTRREDRDFVRKLMEKWYRNHARALFTRRLDHLHGMIERDGIPKPEFNIRKMRKRWGSCTRSGSILLNTELVKVPIHCIDYVIMHELCHLQVRKHDSSFYRLLSRCMPGWEKRKERLDRIVL